MGEIHWMELVFVAATFVVLTTYHAYWVYQMRRAPLRTYRGVTKHLRRAWVESCMNERRDLLSVQTLRNWIMASSFLASTAMIISLGIMGYLFKPEYLSQIFLNPALMLSQPGSLFMLKLMVLLVHFFFAFFTFTLSIRYMNQVNFMINVPIECDPMLTPDFIAHTLDMGMVHYTLGMRAYHLSVVVILWLFGSLWMFLGSLVLVYVLYQLDHCCTLDYSTASCDIKMVHTDERP